MRNQADSSDMTGHNTGQFLDIQEYWSNWPKTSLMKMLFDFFPILLFFAAYKFYGIYVATMTAIAATFVQVSLYWIKHRRFQKMHLITLVLISVMGGITIYLQDPMFIKWKTTFVEWAFALAFLGSQFIGKKNFVERMMGSAITAPDHIWKKLNLAWVAFFILMGAINLYVIYNFDTDTWVNFKTFGMLGMTLVFIITQGVFLTKYINREPPADDSTNKEEG